MKKSSLARSLFKRRARRTGPSPAVVEIVHRRSGGYCELCGADAVHIHHRQPRGMGGSRGEAGEAINRPFNLLHLCLTCHENTERYRRDAYTRGRLVPRPENPRMWPVETRHGWVLLTDTPRTLPYARTTSGVDLGGAV